MAQNKVRVGGSFALGGVGSVWPLVRRLKSLECLGDRHPSVPGDWLGRFHSHRLNPELHFHLKIFTVEGGRGVHKGRLKGVTGKYLKIFLYESSHA